MKTFTTMSGSVYSIINKGGKEYLHREGKKEIRNLRLAQDIAGSKSKDIELFEVQKLVKGESAIFLVKMENELEPKPLSTSIVVSVEVT